MTPPDTIAATRVPTWLHRTPVLVVAVLVALAATVLVASIGADDTSLPTVAPAAATDDDADPTPTDVREIDPKVVPVMTYEVFLTRDPFQPVVPEDEPTPTLEPGDPSSPTSPDPTSPTPVVPRDPEDPACVGSEEVVCEGRVLSLLDITTMNGEPLAVGQVDTIVYQVFEEQVFAGNFRVHAIDGSCLSVLYGDDSFRLCLGDTILK